MPTLFGKHWTRDEFLRRVGDVRQAGGAAPFVLDEGPERGVRGIDVRTGTGFRFTLLPDRGLDVWTAEINGAPLGWQSSTGPVAPAYFEPEGLGWLRGFYGGMLVTCGLSYLGAPNRDEKEDLGLHGRASYLPAYEVGVTQGWEGDEYRIEVRGKIRETRVFGEHLVLTRRIRTSLGSSGFSLEDEVENLGHEPAPHMIMYHVNGGFPLLDESAELLSPSIEARPVDRESEKEKERYNRFLPPTAGFVERCYYHTLRGGEDGRTTVALVNRVRGLGYALRYSLNQLPAFTQWKMMGEGIYVCGTEPGNVFPAPRERHRREGTLPFLQPGEKKTYALDFAALASFEEIGAVEKEIHSLGEK